MCCCLDLPTPCSEYLGDQSIECLNTLWSVAGCSEEGNKHPTKLSPEEVGSFAVINIK